MRLHLFAAGAVLAVALAASAPAAVGTHFCEYDHVVDLGGEAYLLVQGPRDGTAAATWFCIESNGVAGPQRGGGVTLLGDVEICQDAPVGDLCNLHGVF